MGGPSNPHKEAAPPQFLSTVKFITGIAALVLVSLGGFVWLLNSHWSFGFILLLCYGYATWLAIFDLKARTYGLKRGVGAIVLLVCLSAAMFATVSFMLYQTGMAAYGGGPALAFADFLRYYGWLFLDLLPALDISQSLGLDPHIQPDGVMAGLPIVAFKGFVLLILLRVIKDWWNG